MSVYALYHFDGKGKRKEYRDPEALFSKLGRAGFIWIDIDDPGQAELAGISERLGIHPLAVEDCLDENQIPKMEDYPTHSFILLNRFKEEGEELKLAEIDFIFNGKFLVSVHGHEGGKADPEFYVRMRDSVLKLPGGKLVSTEIFLHSLVDFIVDEKLPLIESIQDKIDLAEERILQEPASFDPREFFRLRSGLLDLAKSLSHEREIIIKILYGDSPYLSENSSYYFRDVYDHISRFTDLVDRAREKITSHTELYFSAMNNLMNKASIAANRTMRRLTMITTIFMPLSLLAGIGGMSEWTMMTGQGNWRMVYPLTLGGMALLGILTFLILRNRGKK